MSYAAGRAREPRLSPRCLPRHAVCVWSQTFKRASSSAREIVVVSMDLPFAQKRWCGAANADKVITASDHREASFGKNYGLLISGGPLDRVLARAVFVVGADNKLKHVEYVGSIGEHPNYDAALAAAK